METLDDLLGTSPRLESEDVINICEYAERG